MNILRVCKYVYDYEIDFVRVKLFEYSRYSSNRIHLRTLYTHLYNFIIRKQFFHITHHHQTNISIVVYMYLFTLCYFFDYLLLFFGSFVSKEKKNVQYALNMNHVVDDDE